MARKQTKVPAKKGTGERKALSKALELVTANPDLSRGVVVRESVLPLYDGLGKTQRNEKIRAGEYPAPFQISDSGRAKAWFLSEILAWQEQRRRVRDEALAARKASRL